MQADKFSNEKILDYDKFLEEIHGAPEFTDTTINVNKNQISPLKKGNSKEGKL